MTRYFVPAFRLALFASAATATIAYAQPADTANPQFDAGDIVVTATRQSQALSRVPLAVTAYTQETLDQQGVRKVDDVARLTPGVSFTRSAVYSSSQSNITVRGVRSTSGVPTTGIYIDDTPVQTRVGSSQSLTNPYPQIFDLDRVEVLRGPQGTLFGAGSVGGAVRFITPAPNLDRASVYGRAELAFTKNGSPTYEAGAAVGAPIIEGKLGFRASAWHRHDGGYVDWVDRYDTGRVIKKDSNRADNFAGRFALGWKPTETVTITPSVFFQHTNNEDTPSYYESLSNASDGYVQANALRQSSADRFWLPALKVELELGRAELISNTSYLARRVRNRYDGTSLNLASFAGVRTQVPPQALRSFLSPSTLANDQKVFTQEIRLQNTRTDSILNWVIGGFYSHSKIRDRYFAAAPDLLSAINYNRGVQGLPPRNSVAEQFGVNLYQNQYLLYLDGDLIDKQSAVFAQADLEVAEGLKLTAGLRYQDVSFKATGFRAGPVIGSAGSTYDLGQSDKPLTPKFGISWQIDRNNLIYANVSKGYRVGSAVQPVGRIRCGADADAIGFNPDINRVIEPDSVWSYELGTKNKFADNRITLDASIYRIDWKNVQTLLTLPSCSVPTTVNFGDARSQGFDIAVTARPVDPLSLGLSVSHTDAKYTNAFPGAGGVLIRAKDEPLGVAPWTLYSYGQIDLPVGGHDAYFRADYSYSSHDSTPLTVSPIINPDYPRPPAIHNLDLRVGTRLDGADLSLFVANVTNSQPRIARYEDTPASNWFRAVTLRPRTVGVTLTIRK